MNLGNPKDYYKTYLADDKIGELGARTITEIINRQPVHAFEFGCGTGKHLARLQKNWNIEASGIDISPMNVAKAIFGYGLNNVCVGDETYLRHYANYDVVFTVSVLDHISSIDGIIAEFQRIANKAIFLAETNDIVGDFYYKHDYRKLGFTKLPFEWKGEDGGIYHIWQLLVKP